MNAAIVHFSYVLLRGKGFGFAGEHTIPSIRPSVWELVDLSRSTLRNILTEAEDLPDEGADIAL